MPTGHAMVTELLDGLAEAVRLDRLRGGHGPEIDQKLLLLRAALDPAARGPAPEGAPARAPATRAEALAEARRLDAEAARLSSEARALLDRADALRAEHCGWLERQMAAASAEVACWSEEKRAEFRRCHGPD